MIIIRLTKACPYVRLWAAQKILESNSPYPLVSIIQSPDHKETLVFMKGFRIKENQPYLDMMPVAHSPQISQEEYYSLMQRATTTAMDMDSARQQLTTALKNKQDMAIVVSLEKQQQQLSARYASELNRIVKSNEKSTESLQDPDHVSSVLAFCISHLVYIGLLPPMLPLRKMESVNNYSLSIIDVSGEAKAAVWLQQQKVKYSNEDETSYTGSIIFPENPKTKYQGFRIFDSTVGLSHYGPAFKVREDMLKLAKSLSRSYDLKLKNPVTTRKCSIADTTETKFKVARSKKQVGTKVTP